MKRSWRRRHTLASGLWTGFAWLIALLACVPLLSVLYMLLVKGGSRLSLAVFTELPPVAFEPGGGFGNAIVGTGIMVAIAALLSVPAGILTALYLREFGRGTRIAGVARFCIKTLTGMPSILAGVFAYAAVVLMTGGYSAPAGGVALSLLMLPTVVLTAEEALAAVPDSIREAACGLGSTPTQATLRVVLPAALPAAMTGIMLAVARASGETAPLLFTALFSDYWINQLGEVELMEPTASLAVLIYNYSGMPFENQIELAWAASLVLVVLVMLANALGRLIGTRHRGER
ncbi:MAG: phosphate ABC transporter permease PstA [Pseudomonadota bacterium]